MGLALLSVDILTVGGLCDGRIGFREDGVRLRSSQEMAIEIRLLVFDGAIGLC